MKHRRKLSFITCMHSFTQITSWIELRGIVPSNQIKVTFIIIGLLGGGVEGGGGPLSNYWVGLNPPPPSYAYEAPEQQNNGHQT